ncbi:MAG: type IV pilin N-terminal domain-containing protein [Methanoregula sp.]|nr:type IV pilin N-terminal domain-containing protein [Methanoregula sp.]
MRIDRSVNQKMDTSAGVSETVGAIMLISIVAILIAVIGVYLFSQPVPQKIPNLNFMTGVNSDKTTLYIYHNGGDTLNVGEFSVLLDGKEVSYSVSGGGNQWSLGKNLVVTPLSTMPQSVQLVYNNTASSGGPGSTGAVLLDEASVNIVSSVTVSPDQLPYLDCSAVRNWDCADQIPPEIILDRYLANATSQRINFMKNNVNNGITGSGSNKMQYHFNFTVTEVNSTISWGAADCDPVLRVPLQPDDKVSVAFDSNGGPADFIIYGLAPQIWEMAGGLANDLLVTVTFSNNTVINSDDDGPGGRLCHTWVAGYKDIESTMVINGEGVSGSPETVLVVNETFYINGPSSSDVVLVNFRPTDNGMFLVSFPGSAAAPVYMIGWADQIKIDGVVQTGLGV